MANKVKFVLYTMSRDFALAGKDDALFHGIEVKLVFKATEPI